MKILWVSPYGDGWAIAYRLRQAGNKVVLCSDARYGEGYLPMAPLSAVDALVHKADLVLLDHNFPSRTTRRSFEPSDNILQLNAVVKKRGVPYVGPTPTTELIENDRRYCMKVLHRSGLGDWATDKEFVGHLKVHATVSVDPETNPTLVLRATEGELRSSDLVVPLAGTEPLVRFVEPLLGFLKSIGYNGYVNLDLALHETGPQAEHVRTSFLYPAIFAQFGSRLHGHVTVVSSAVTVFVDEINERNSRSVGDEILAELGGFFPYELYREGEDERVGKVAGALVSVSSDFRALKTNVDNELAGRQGLRGSLDDRLFDDLLRIHDWGYI